MSRLPSPGPGRPHHPGQFREPPSERQQTNARAAATMLRKRHPNRRRGLRGKGYR
jgi:hypothetical protein